MSELAREKLQKSQVKQKTWYDRKTREQSFDKGDKMLVLLPSSTNKLSPEWQGSYPIERKFGKLIMKSIWVTGERSYECFM